MRVLLATDGSVHARVATQWLMVFPLVPTAEILVLAAVVPVPPLAVLGARREAPRASVTVTMPFTLDRVASPPPPWAATS